MKKQEMTDALTERAQTIRGELVTLQDQFNAKKEQLTRIEGALEALSALEPDGDPPASEDAPEEGGTEE